jgi:hypothetical protein
MTIKTVTEENLAEYVKSRPNPEQIAAAAAAHAEPAAEVVKGTVTETVSTAPDPGKQPTEEERKTKKPKNDVQSRIDELVRERHELDEAFQSEYEQRLRLEGELNSLKSREQKPEPVVEDTRPDKTKYTDADKYEDDLLAWNRRESRREYIAEEARKDAERRAREADAAMVKKIAAAKADLEDFDVVIDRADKRSRGDIPNHIKAAFYESDVGAHLAYHLAKNADEEKRIFAMTPAAALLELGKLESTYRKKPAEKSAETAPPPVTKTPEPVARLKEGAGIVQSDLTQPMDFNTYRRARVEQIRASRRR